MVLVIDPQIAGIAGDMLLCSLVDMGADVEKIKKCASMGAQIADKHTKTGILQSAKMRYISYKTHTRD